MRKLFGIDPRSLGAFRIGLGLLLLIDVGIRATDLVAHYTDAGVVPRPLVADYVQCTWRWSVHMLGGSATYQAALFTLAALAAVAVTVGYRTRLATCLSWLLLVSLHGRNPLVVNGGDVILRMLLFWSMFLPLGCTWSVDRYRKKWTMDRPVLSVATAVILLQVCLMYWMTGYFKLQGAWQEADGFEQVLQFDSYAKPLAYWLLGFPTLLPWIGYAILGLEILGPILVFSPIWTTTIRLAVIACFVLLHLGIEMSLTVGLFSYVSILAWVLFLPSPFWNVCSRRQDSDEPSATGVSDRRPNGEMLHSPSYVINGLVALLFLAVVVWNVSTVSGSWARALRSRPLKRLDDLIVLRQKWDLFTNPLDRDGWYVVVARLKDGRVVDLLRDGQPADWNSFEKPAYIYRRYPNHRWRKLYRNLSRGHGNRCCGPLCRYLAGRWNDSQPDSAAVAAIELHFMQPLDRLPEEQDRFMQRILHQEELHGVREGEPSL